MRKFRFIIALAVASTMLCCLVSCNPKIRFDKRWAKKSGELSESLNLAATDFNSTISWKNYDNAANGVLPETRVEFLEKAEQVGPILNIEDFKIATAVVSLTPFERDDEEGDKDEDREEATPEPTPEPKVTEGEAAAGDSATPEVEDPDKYKMPKIFYGFVMVRYVNMNVLPSTSVHNKLIKQYWVYFEKEQVWYCDIDLEELVE